MIGSSTNYNPTRVPIEESTYLNGSQEDTIETDKGTLKTESAIIVRRSDTYNITALRKWKIERPNSQRPQKNAKKSRTNCGEIIYSVQDCRRPRDYRPGTAYDNLPYQTVNRKTGLEEGRQRTDSYVLQLPKLSQEYQGNSKRPGTEKA